MARTDFKTVDAYIAARPDSSRPVLEAVRAAVRDARPDAVEVISYQIPAYRVPAGTAIHFAGWKAHYSLYPVGQAEIAAFGDELAPYDVNARGTMRLPLDAPVPAGLIGRIAKFRAQRVAEAQAAKPAKRRG